MSLETVPLFANLNHGALQDLRKTVITRVYPANTIVVRQGDPADAMYIVQSGQVNVVLTNDDGDEVPLATLSAGEYFGEMALIDTEPRSATVATLEETELLILPRAGFEQVLTHYPVVAAHLLREMSRRLREVEGLVKGFVRSDVLGRLTRFLAVFAEPVANENLLDIEWTPERIAELIGTNPENVRNTLDILERQGFIAQLPKGIKVHQHHLLPRDLLLIW